jgi:pyruvate dehydrogenase phosphatase
LLTILQDHISSEDAVECVAQWLKTPAKERTLKGLPKEGGKHPLWEDKFFSWMAKPEYFVVENDNAATHLAKNAFGGSRRDLFCALMSSYPPFSRNVRDDITIQVIFFADNI